MKDIIGAGKISKSKPLNIVGGVVYGYSYRIATREDRAEIQWAAKKRAHG